MKTKSRIYHPWYLWEDYGYDFYNNMSGKDKQLKKESVLYMFNDSEKTKECMFFVVDNWKHSMEHNLSNPSINKIAYIGQCACAYFDRVPSSVTAEAWWELSQETRDLADNIAQSAIDRWFNNNKKIQLCLNLD